MFVSFKGIQQVDYSRYPDKDRQLRLLRVYMENLGKFKGMCNSTLTQSYEYIIFIILYYIVLYYIVLYYIIFDYIVILYYYIISCYLYHRILYFNILYYIVLY